MLKNIIGMKCAHALMNMTCECSFSFSLIMYEHCLAQISFLFLAGISTPRLVKFGPLAIQKLKNMK